MLAATLTAIAAAQDAGDTGDANPSRVVLNRQHTDRYTGGDQLEVTVQISASTWEGVTAMGLYEQVPAGWTLAGTRSITGPAPGLTPPAGRSGVLEFLWITPPRVPIAFAYTLQVPAQDSGVRTLSGQVEYRLGGGRLTSNVALSQLEGDANAIPVITLQGNATMTVLAGARFTDPGATAVDEEDGNLTDQIETTGQVDTARPGVYTLIYGVMDSAGNRAEPVRRAVVVENETEAKQRGNGSGSPGAGPRSMPRTGVIDAPDMAANQAPRELSNTPGAVDRPGGTMPAPGAVTGALRPEFDLPRREPETPGTEGAQDTNKGPSGRPAAGTRATTPENSGNRPDKDMDFSFRGEGRDVARGWNSRGLVFAGLLLATVAFLAGGWYWAAGAPRGWRRRR